MRRFVIGFVCLGLVMMAVGGSSRGQSTEPPKAGAGEQVAASGDSTKLVAIKTVKAVYPIAAARDGVQGQVIVKFLISENGDVEEAEAESGSNPELARAAVDAAKKWKFQPYIKNGKAVKMRTKFPFDFAFAGNVKDSKPVDAPAVFSKTIPRLSGGVAAGNLVHKVTPVYPAEAKAARISGKVVLAATISITGAVESLHVVSGHPMLVDAAMGAVRQWRYRPFLLEGEPTEVETTIEVNFNMR